MCLVWHQPQEVCYLTLRMITEVQPGLWRCDGAGSRLGKGTHPGEGQLLPREQAREWLYDGPPPHELLGATEDIPF